MRASGEDFGLRQVGGQHRGARHQKTLQRVDRRRFDQRRAAFRDHDRIEDERHLRRPLGEHRGDGLDHRGIVQHAGLDRVGPDIVEHDLDLLPDEFGRDRQYPENAERVLRRQRRDRRGGETVEHRHGLDVGLNAGAAARIGAGDDQHPPLHRPPDSKIPAS